MTLLRNIGFFVLAVVLFILLLPIAIVYSIVKYTVLLFVNPNRVYKGLSKLFISLALSIDQLGNVMLQAPMNDLMVRKNGHKYGDEDETISQVAGENKLLNASTKWGILFTKILDFIFEDNHVINAVNYHRKKVIKYYDKYLR